MASRRILLIVSGGIAAYKVLETVRLLRRTGIGVRAILTEGGARFVTSESLRTLTEEAVHRDLFASGADGGIDHIRLSRDADLLLIAPASADLLAKMAAGLADDLASTVLLASDKPVMAAPAMNVRMWRHPATRANIATLSARGVTMIGPAEGEMACNEYGPGRMAEAADIATAVRDALATDTTLTGRLSGLRALVTGGPTHEPIDPVRYIANRSSGKQAYAVATALAGAGAATTLVSGPTALTDPPGVNVIRVVTATGMLAACEVALPVDICVCAAAVVDWRVERGSKSKLKKRPGNAPPTLALVENPDILARLSRPDHGRPRLVVGFAAETGDAPNKAQAKRRTKGCDWMVANDISGNDGVFGSDRNAVHLIADDGDIESWPVASKAEVANRLVGRIADRMEQTSPQAPGLS